MKIIPAIDIIEGKCVRLTKGDYASAKTYSHNPVEVARQFEDAGIKHLHLVDLDGAKSNRIINYGIISKIASQTSLVIDFGGGLKSSEDVKIAFENGAHKITAGSIAIKDPDRIPEWLSLYGNDRILLGADCSDRKIAVGGWLEKSDEDVVEFISRYKAKGIETVVCTDISRDGMLIGPAHELYAEILSKTNISLIASGGISSVNDLDILKKAGCSGAIIGKAIYEGQIKLKELYRLC
jgi:phosphoribosylformimino-5-aminoimidazole carboxamide ribotide isomerase